MAAKEITLIVPASTPPREEGDNFEEQVGGKAIKVSMAKIQRGLEDLNDEIEAMIGSIKEKLTGAAKPEAISIGLTITASGGIGFASLGGEVSLELTYKV